MNDDAVLLRRYVAEKSEEAFAELVRRHLRFVYAAALRRLNGDSHSAADVTQTVFIKLARDASKLSQHSALAGWLYTTTRNAAVDRVRVEQRRKARTSLWLRPGGCFGTDSAKAEATLRNHQPRAHLVDRPLESSCGFSRSWP
jgi:RNA polymerase sigma factor (sigma-70 family)